MYTSPGTAHTGQVDPATCLALPQLYYVTSASSPVQACRNTIHCWDVAASICSTLFAPPYNSMHKHRDHTLLCHGPNNMSKPHPGPSIVWGLGLGPKQPPYTHSCRAGNTARKLSTPPPSYNILYAADTAYAMPHPLGNLWMCLQQPATNPGGHTTSANNTCSVAQCAAYASC